MQNQLRIYFLPVENLLQLHTNCHEFYKITVRITKPVGSFSTYVHVHMLSSYLLGLEVGCASTSEVWIFLIPQQLCM